MFLILDAGAHSDGMVVNNIIKYTAIAAKKGIRIVPIICSGLQKTDEAMLRAIALATNGTNIYLSSILAAGAPLIKPSADAYKIETLSELLNRITRQFSIVPECDNMVSNNAINITDSLLYSPNPNGPADSAFAHLKNAIWNHHVDSVKSNDTSKAIKHAIIGHTFVKIYPNPTSGLLKIKTSVDIRTMYLADVTGKILQPIRIVPESITEVNLEQYASGIYFLKYPTSNGWGAERIVLQKTNN